MFGMYLLREKTQLYELLRVNKPNRQVLGQPPSLTSDIPGISSSKKTTKHTFLLFSSRDEEAFQNTS